MLIKSIVDQTVIPSIQRSHKLRRIFYYMAERMELYGYDHYKTLFIKNGSRSLYGEDLRRQVVERFEQIDRSVPISTSKTDGLIMAEALFSVDAPNAEVVECGCYAGGSTAKLSIICKIAGRSLRVFDSFAGLPNTDSFYRRDYNARESEAWMSEWSEGSYAGKLDYVQENIGKFGELSVCRFYPGWFESTLIPGNLPESIAFAFTDVDLASSARTCLERIWPRLLRNGIYFSHDVAFIKVLQSIMDAKLWQEILKEFPPVLMGAGYGMGDASPELGFFVKGPASAQYINSLALSK